MQVDLKVHVDIVTRGVAHFYFYNAKLLVGQTETDGFIRMTCTLYLKKSNYKNYMRSVNMIHKNVRMNLHSEFKRLNINSTISIFIRFIRS